MAENKDETIQFFPDKPSQVPPKPSAHPSALDEELAKTFPASDPPTITQPKTDTEVSSTQSAHEERVRKGT